MRFFLDLYRQQVGAGPEAAGGVHPAAVRLDRGSNLVYELRVKTRRRLGQTAHDHRPVGRGQRQQKQVLLRHLRPAPGGQDPSQAGHGFRRLCRQHQKGAAHRRAPRPQGVHHPQGVGHLEPGSSAVAPPRTPRPNVLEEKYIAWLRKNPEHQDYLKIKGTFVFFMDLSRYYFLSHIIDGLHDLGGADPVRDQLHRRADPLPGEVQGTLRRAKTNRWVLKSATCITSARPTVRQLLKNSGKSADRDALPHPGLVPELPGKEATSAKRTRRCPPDGGSPASRPSSRGCSKNIANPWRLTLGAIRSFAGACRLEQNRQIIAGIVTNLLDLLAWLSAKQVAMRDLKPDNLLVAGDPQNYPAFLRSAADYSLGFIDVETAVYFGKAEENKIKQPLLGGTPYYATPSHLFPNSGPGRLFRGHRPDPAFSGLAGGPGDDLQGRHRGASVRPHRQACLPTSKTGWPTPCARRNRWTLSSKRSAAFSGAARPPSSAPK
ncbi:MAG: hypothetical protein MZV70_28985 [Desulfobacterales bacterium]|nr:hypothetical protein [Desulfobacterales bacterium]